MGSGGTEITLQGALYGEKAFHKVRRFVVIRPRRGHSICIPILTYGYQGVLKHGVHPETHAAVYSSAKGPSFLPGEDILMKKRPVKIDVKDPSEKLDPLSRLNYAKLYTVEHNVKVYFIGSVARKCEMDVAASFNAEHSPVGPRPYGHYPDSTVYRHAEGPAPDIYQAAPSIPTSSESYPDGLGQNPSYYASSQPYGISYPYNAQPQPSPAGQNQPETVDYADGYDAD
jgi:hypothetical protein